MKDPDCKYYPTTCVGGMLYVWGIDLTRMTYQDLLRLFEYGFMPGMEDDYGILTKYLGEDSDWTDLTEEVWLQLRDQLSDCVRSYEF